MREILFYRQKRVDGGVRTAILVNDGTAFEQFQSGKDDSDPALTWFIDLRCRGKELPDSPEEARQFLLKNSKIIKEGFALLAEKLETGLDFEFDPLQWPVPNSPKGVRMQIVCGATLRKHALTISRELANIAENWEKYVRNLPREVSHAH